MFRRRSRLGIWALAAFTGVAGFAFGSPAYAVFETQIDGEFEGCEFDKMYPLNGGGILICREYQYQYAYSPQVIVIDSSTVLIDKEKYSASVLPGEVVETHVSDDFEGCEFGKRIMLDSNLIFICSMYKYHYSYRPKVQIFFPKGMRYQVFIDGEKYDGQLYRTK